MQNKFPWIQFFSTFVLYLFIALILFTLSSILPKKVQKELTKEEVAQIQQQEQVNQTRAIYSEILGRVSKLIVIPQQILPEISVINDMQKFIGENPVFAGAQNGDVILMYTDRIIVYSPTANRIINSVIIPTSQQKAIQQAQKQAEAPVVTTPAVKK